MGGTCLLSRVVEGEVSVWQGARRCTVGGVGFGEAYSGCECGSDIERAWIELEWRRPVSTILSVLG